MYRVALVMITRDDARHVERALASAQPHVDEMVVLDLGSNDETVQRAEALGARVEHFTWSEDPSVLWNRALSATDAAWNVILEPHEWIDEGRAALSELRQIGPDSVGLVEVVPGAAARGTDAPSLQPRILPAGVRYAGRYRCEPLYPGMRTWRTPLVMASDDAKVFGWSVHRDLVGGAVQQALSVEPNNPLLLAAYGRWQRAEGQPGGAADTFARAADAVGRSDPSRHLYVIETLDALRAAHRFGDALALVDAELPNQEASPDFSYLVGDLFLEMIIEDRHKAKSLAPMAEACWRKAMSIGDRPELEGALTGRGSFLAAQSMYVLHTIMGHPQEAEYWLEKAAQLREAAPYAPRPRLLG